MSNPVLILTRNCLELTKRCFQSVVEQDVRGIVVVFGDNDSTDGTRQWAYATKHFVMEHTPEIGVSAAWNLGLEWLFSFNETEHVLVVNNDTILSPSTYREMLSYDLPFVTGVAVNLMEQLLPPNGDRHLDPHPDFSLFLIKRKAWETVGPFNEKMKLYASDCAWHVEAHRKGIPLYKVPIPYYHERSSTLRLAPPAEQKEILEQAHKDREMFKSIYSCVPGTVEYENLFK